MDKTGFFLNRFLQILHINGGPCVIMVIVSNGPWLYCMDSNIMESIQLTVTVKTRRGKRGYNLKFLKKNRSKYFVLKKMMPNS